MLMEEIREEVGTSFPTKKISRPLILGLPRAGENLKKKKKKKKGYSCDHLPMISWIAIMHVGGKTINKLDSTHFGDIFMSFVMS